MTAAERTRMREAWDRDQERYAAELAIYDRETARWEQLFRGVGRVPPATQRTPPQKPARPAWGTCTACGGTGAGGHEYYEVDCWDCRGTGDEP